VTPIHNLLRIAYKKTGKYSCHVLSPLFWSHLCVSDRTSQRLKNSVLVWTTPRCEKHIRLWKNLGNHFRKSQVPGISMPELVCSRKTNTLLSGTQTFCWSILAQKWTRREGFVSKVIQSWTTNRREYSKKIFLKNCIQIQIKKILLFLLFLIWNLPKNKIIWKNYKENQVIKKNIFFSTKNIHPIYCNWSN